MGSVKQAKELLLEFISFSTPRAIVANFSLIFLILIVLPTEQVKYLPVASVWENVFGIVPYSSGMTRGLSSILHGNFQRAWEFNPLSFAALVTMAMLIAYNIRKLKGIC